VLGGGVWPCFDHARERKTGQPTFVQSGDPVASLLASLAFAVVVGATEEVIQKAYDAFRRGDIEGAVARWHDDGELTPLPGGGAYRGREGVRLFLERDIHERDEFDIRVYTILEQADYALVFGRYSLNEGGRVVDKGVFWIARVEEGRLTLFEAHDNVGEAMATFKERLGLVWS
jgi:ketosteroid isomerase-like protein